MPPSCWPDARAQGTARPAAHEIEMTRAGPGSSIPARSGRRRDGDPDRRGRGGRRPRGGGLAARAPGAGLRGGARRAGGRAAAPRRAAPVAEARGDAGDHDDGGRQERRAARRPAAARGARCAPARRRSRAGSRELGDRERVLADKAGELEEAREHHIRELERVAGMPASQARKQLLKELEDQTRHDRAKVVRQIEEETKRDADRRVRNILSVVMQRLAAGHAAETTVSVVQLSADDMKGRIIGREGRNIRALEHLTGVDFIIDDTPNAVILSGFDGVRREIARMTLEKLLQDGRIHPARIEETYYQAKSELEAHIAECGEQACFDANVQALDADLVVDARPAEVPHLLRPERARALGRVRPPRRDDGPRAGRVAQDRAPRRAAARHRQGRLARDRGPARARRRRPRPPPRRVRGGRPRDGGPPQRGRAADRRGRDRPGRGRALRRPPGRPRRVARAVRQAPARPRAHRDAPRRRRQGLRDAGRARDPRHGRSRTRSTTTARSCSRTRSRARSSRSSSTPARSR